MLENQYHWKTSIDKYVEILIMKYPKVDLHLLEYVVVASDLLYEIMMLRNKKNKREQAKMVYIIK